jgi:Family of unknown function (DUF6011)
MTRRPRRDGDQPYVAPTVKMTRYALNLAAERRLDRLGATGDARVAELQRQLDARELDKFGVMRLLDELKAAPRDDQGEPGGLVPGVYRRNGVIYVVRQNRTNDRVHARRLVEIGGRRLNELDDVVQIEFVYDRDALQQLRPIDQMTLSDARPYIIRYGRCIFCNTALKDATSVARGVGPVCIKRYAPEPEPVEDPAVAAARDARLTDLLAQLRGRS